MIYVIATLTVRPGEMETVLDLAAPCVSATRNEDGCISYDLLRSTGGPDQIVFVERWESRAALEAHFTQPHLIAWRDAGAPYLTDKKVEIVDPASVDML